MARAVTEEEQEEQEQEDFGGPAVCLPDLSGVQFPPGLLAANPSLVGAKPGSLVVVAGPQKAQETRSPPHLYMLQVKEKEMGGKGGPVLASRTVKFSSKTDSLTELRLDPASGNKR